MASSLELYLMANPDHAKLAKSFLPITYTITYSPLAVSVQNSPAQITTNGGFLCTRISATQTAVGNATYILTPLLVSFTITAKNYNYTAQQTEWGTSGIQINPSNATNDSDLPWPLFIPNASVIQTAVTNPLAVASNVWLSFIGIQLQFSPA